MINISFHLYNLIPRVVVLSKAPWLYHFWFYVSSIVLYKCDRGACQQLLLILLGYCLSWCADKWPRGSCCYQRGPIWCQGANRRKWGRIVFSCHVKQFSHLEVRLRFLSWFGYSRLYFKKKKQFLYKFIFVNFPSGSAFSIFSYRTFEVYPFQHMI